MEKKFIVCDNTENVAYVTEDEAVVRAKRNTSKYAKPYYVFQAIAKVEAPLPEAIVTKL